MNTTTTTGEESPEATAKNHGSKADLIELNEGELVHVLRWAAQCYSSTYYYLRLCEVSKNKKGELFFKPLNQRAHGRRGKGTLRHLLPELTRVKAGKHAEMAAINF